MDHRPSEGPDTKEKIYRNFGMPRPEGYRKALRLMKLAEKFGVPVMTFVDTPGAYPGIDAEERGQSEAIGRNLYVMAELKVPVIVTIIGEGGSGGALATPSAIRCRCCNTRPIPSFRRKVARPSSGRVPKKAPGRCRNHGHHGASPENPGPGRQGGQRTAGRRPPRPCRDGAKPQEGLAGCPEAGVALSTGELLEQRYERLMSYGRFGTNRFLICRRVGAFPPPVSPMPDCVGRSVRRLRFRRCLPGCRRASVGQPSSDHVHHGLSPNADAWAEFCA